MKQYLRYLTMPLTALAIAIFFSLSIVIVLAFAIFGVVIPTNRNSN
jgi:hypothetical protein